MPTTELQTGVCFKNILLATDFSDASKHALAYAAAFARLHDAKLFVAHVMSPEPHPSIPIEPYVPPNLDRIRVVAERDLRNLATEEPLQHMSYEEVLEEGPIGNVVSNIIRQKEIDLLVLGTHGRTGLKKLLLGSVAEELFRLASCPVLTVGPAAIDRTGKAEIQRVLFVTDFGAASLKALPYAISLANESAGKLTLLHVVPPIPVSDVGSFWYPGTNLVEGPEIARRSSLERLQKLIPPGTGLACSLDLKVEFTSVPEGILEVASERQMDLIVMGVKRSSMARAVAHLPWAIGHEVVCRAKCPVLTVRA